MIHTEKSEVTFEIVDFHVSNNAELEAHILKQMLYRMIERLTLSDLPKEFKFTVVDPRKEDINMADIERTEYLMNLMEKQVIDFKVEYNQI
jgi:hypothetical protein